MMKRVCTALGLMTLGSLTAYANAYVVFMNISGNPTETLSVLSSAQGGSGMVRVFSPDNTPGNFWYAAMNEENGAIGFTLHNNDRPIPIKATTQNEVLPEGYVVVQNNANQQAKVNISHTYYGYYLSCEPVSPSIPSLCDSLKLISSNDSTDNGKATIVLYR